MSAPSETIVIYGGQRWGRGSDLAEAKRNWRAQGGRLSNGYVVLTFDAATEFKGFDQMGRYHWVGNEPTEQEIQPRKPSGAR
jgi:hypothetical protein